MTNTAQTSTSYAPQEQRQNLRNTDKEDGGGDAVFFQGKTSIENMDRRIEKVQNLLQQLKQERKELEEGSPPKPERPMEEHITDVAERLNLTEDDLITRTRKTADGEKKRLSGFNKDGVVKINYKLVEMQQIIEDLKN